jgi:secondary thiamine-phosphate synthase enzyme
MMMQTEFEILTNDPGLTEITSNIRSWVTQSGVETGLLTLFIRHTSASLLIQENADPEVRDDLIAFFSRLVPPSDDPSMAYLTHTYEGPDDMPSHIKAALLPTHLCIPVAHGLPVLGTWQGIYLVEHRTRRHRRQVAAHLSS